MGCGSSKELASSNAPAARVQDRPFQDARSIVQSGPSGGRPGNASSAQGGMGNRTAPGVWPKRIQQPNMPFVVHIHHHLFPSPPMGELPCWTYISEGLSTDNQPEIIFTLRRRAQEHQEDFPPAPIEWMRNVHQLAREGINLELGQTVDLIFEKNTVILRLNQFILPQVPAKWMSMRPFGILVHGFSLGAGTLRLPRGVIKGNEHHVIALTHQEAVVAREFGPTRVIGHVGLAVRWFPYPPWVDRDRKDCVLMSDQAGSVRSIMPIARMYGFNAMVVDDEIVFTIPGEKAKREAFKTYVREAPLVAPLAFDSFMSEEANSGLIWKTGQKNPMTYNTIEEIEKCNLGFIIFVPEQDRDSFNMTEDGYGIRLRNETWGTVREAIETTRDIVVPLAEGMRFRLVWANTVYVNPLDGKEYKATPYPLRPDARYPHVQMSEIVFLIEPPPGTGNVGNQLTYVSQIENVLKQIIPAHQIPLRGTGQVGRQLIVEIDMPKSKGWLKMTASPTMEGLPSQDIFSAIGTIAQPPTQFRIKFHLIANLWGYQKPQA